MYKTITAAGNGKPAPSALALALFDKSRSLPKHYGNVDERCGGAIADAIQRAEFNADAGSVTTVYPQKGRIKRIFIVGLGDKGKFTADVLRSAAGRLCRAAHAAKVTRLSLQICAAIGRKLDGEAIGRAVGEGLALAAFNFDQFKGAAASSENGKTLRLRVDIDRPANSGLRNGLMVGESANIARSLAATPPNIANPTYLVRYCRNMAKRAKLRCTVIDKAKARQLKMGGLLAVGQAGSTPPALIQLEYRPARKPAATILLVGKAITFDTGGYSLKINNGMLGMKYDKCGGMAVIGAMHAVAKLKPKVRVIGLIAAAENMVDTTAYRPDDIITFCNGVTCEVTNTDAEGRLVLADALAYGCKTFKPDAAIDLATLTGGVVVALGRWSAGVFCGDRKLREHLFDAADQSGERLWHLPLWEEHRAIMKSNHADIMNSSTKVSREAHPIQGAAFLSFFAAPDADPNRAGELPWAHIDIAGVAETKESGALFEPGPTGFGVRLLARAIESWSKR